MNAIEKIKHWFGRAAHEIEAETEDHGPVATPPAGSSGDTDRETSTNAQMEGASDEPWSGNR